MVAKNQFLWDSTFPWDLQSWWPTKHYSGPQKFCLKSKKVTFRERRTWTSLKFNISKNPEGCNFQLNILSNSFGCSTFLESHQKTEILTSNREGIKKTYKSKRYYHWSFWDEHSKIVFPLPTIHKIASSSDSFHIFRGPTKNGESNFQSGRHPKRLSGRHSLKSQFLLEHSRVFDIHICFYKPNNLKLHISIEIFQHARFSGVRRHSVSPIQV